MEAGDSETREVQIVLGGARSGPHTIDRGTLVRLSRFFSKLLAEVTNLSATSIVLSAGDEVEVQLRMGDRLVRSLSVGAGWFLPLCSWIADRKAYAFDSSGTCDIPDLGSIAQWKFQAILNAGSRILKVQVSSLVSEAGVAELHLRELQSVAPEALFEQLGVSEKNRSALEQMGSEKHGLILVMGESVSDRIRGAATLRSLIEAFSIESIEQSGEISQVAALCAEQRVIAGFAGSDPVEALRSLSDQGVNLAELPFCGSFSQFILPRVCQACSSGLQLQNIQCGEIPEHLQALAREPGNTARGCQECDNTGIQGTLPVLSAHVLPTEKRKSLLSLPLDLVRLRLEYPSAQSDVLIDDALRRIRMGQLTVQSVIEAAAQWPVPRVAACSVPPVEEQPLDFDAPIALEPDFFIQPEPEKEVEPLRGRGAFTGRVEDHKNEDEEPLFQFLPKAIRTRPLVLIAEDDDDQRAILELFLRNADYDVVSSCDGAHALEMLSSVVPDLIITDLMMPNIDGRGFVTRLKADSRFAAIPVLVLTVVDDVEQEYSLLSLGADDYCEKNVQRKILLKRIENLLRRVNAARPITHPGRGSLGDPEI